MIALETIFLSTNFCNGPIKNEKKKNTLYRSLNKTKKNKNKDLHFAGFQPVKCGASHIWQLFLRLKRGKQINLVSAHMVADSNMSTKIFEDVLNLAFSNL